MKLKLSFVKKILQSIFIISFILNLIFKEIPIIILTIFFFQNLDTFISLFVKSDVLTKDEVNINFSKKDLLYILIMFLIIIILIIVINYIEGKFYSKNTYNFPELISQDNSIKINELTPTVIFEIEHDKNSQSNINVETIHNTDQKFDLLYWLESDKICFQPLGNYEYYYINSSENSIEIINNNHIENYRCVNIDNIINDELLEIVIYSKEMDFLHKFSFKDTFFVQSEAELNCLLSEYEEDSDCLENILRTNLSYEEIQNYSPESVQYLFIGPIEIDTIPRLDKFTSLDGLSISNNALWDLSFVTGLKNLTDLILIDNAISNISPILNLQNLETIDLSGNNLSDISPLVSLEFVMTLYLENSDIQLKGIKDVSSISKLSNLRFLSLKGNTHIENILELNNLKKLQDFNLCYTKISSCVFPEHADELDGKFCEDIKDTDLGRYLEELKNLSILRNCDAY